MDISLKSCSLLDVKRLRGMLDLRGVFCFDAFDTGLFPAVGRGSATERTSGYRSVWVRDNVHIAWAHFVAGRPKAAMRNAAALCDFFETQSARFDAVIAAGRAPRDPMARPHIRFDGTDGHEIDDRWPHAQNDALGAFVWFVGKLTAAGVLPMNEQRATLLNRLIRYFEAVAFWQDEESGHWEEQRKISASSIGAVVAGLGALCAPEVREALCRHGVQIDLAEALHRKAVRALSNILPRECVQADPQKSRKTDAALLFLADPFDILDLEMTTQILADVTGTLQGAHGISRYALDSYWGPDFRSIPAEKRTADLSEDIIQRDAYAAAGREAQWCIFDSVVSIIYSKLYRNRRRPSDLEAQIAYLNRALSQLTEAPDGSGRLLLPEAYFEEAGVWVPNDHLPLQWAHANLLRAMCAMEESLTS